MPKTKAQKQEMVAQLSERITASQAMFVISPKSINPNEANELKMKLSEVGGEYHLVKNTLFKRALEAAGLTPSQDIEAGQNAIVFIGDRSPEAAKIMQKFIKDSEKADFKGGYLEGKAIDRNDVVALADLPSREQMLAQVLATMNAPVSGFVQVLAGNIRNVVTVIDAYKQKKEEAGA